MYNLPDEVLSTLTVGDKVTFRYVFARAFDNLLLVSFIVGVGLVIPSAFCLAFKNTVTKHCSVSTTLISLGLSAMGGLGLVTILYLVGVIFQI